MARFFKKKDDDKKKKRGGGLFKRRKFCRFTAEKVVEIDYKDVDVLKEYIQDLEKRLIEQALDDCSGVVARAADRLRLRRTTLVEKMRKYDLLNPATAAAEA